MRILLVDPPCYRLLNLYRHYFPLGLAYIAAEAMDMGHEVLVYDADHDQNLESNHYSEVSGKVHLYTEALENPGHYIWKEYNKILDEFKPQLVGFSALSVKVKAVILMAMMAKEHNSKIITVAGGDHATVRPQDLLLSGYVDYAVRGEGEKTLCDLISCLQNRGHPEKVQGISWKDPANGICNTPSVPLAENLDELKPPLIDSLYKMETYMPTDMGIMITERGCPYGCTFCGLSTIWGKKVRCHSVGRIITEIKKRNEKYGTKYFSFRNGTFTLSRERVELLCQEFKKLDFPMEWECLTRVNHLDESLLERMMDSGCRSIRIGVESGSPRILKYIKKDISLEQVRKAAGILNKSGIFWAPFFMLGVPEEDRQSMEETLLLMKELDPPFITLSKYTPIPGTPMYNEVLKEGMIKEDTTDWTWGLNQSQDISFVRKMPQGEFQEIMNKVSQYVQEHNQARKDPRWKTNGPQ